MKHLTLLAAVLCCFLTPSNGEAQTKSNVLFLVSDDLRPELGCYDFTIIQSPNIDRLVQRGTVFSRAYCQQAVCSPSRSSVMTVMRPDTTKVWDLNTHFRKALPNAEALGALLRNHGYATMELGKIYHGSFDDPQGWSMKMKTPRASRNSGRKDRRVDHPISEPLQTSTHRS